jgi:hypothetical protein
MVFQTTTFLAMPDDRHFPSHTARKRTPHASLYALQGDNPTLDTFTATVR